LVTQICLSNEMTQKQGQTFELDTTAIRRKIKLLLDIGLASFGVPNQSQT
jgi:hypothetical protein